MAKSGALLRPLDLTVGLTTVASQLRAIEESPRFLPLDVPGLKSLFANGLKPGTITQIEGSRSSGRTAIGAHILAQATARGEICAVVDGQNQLHPESLEQAGIRLNHVVWIRCNGNAEHAMRAVDLLLHAGGFGIVWLDLCEVAPQAIQRIPLSYWFRFRRAIENTATILLIGGDSTCAKSSITNNLQLELKAIDWIGDQGVVRLVKTTATLQKNATTHPLVLHAAV